MIKNSESVLLVYLSYKYTKGSPSGWKEMIPDGKSNSQREVKSIEIINMWINRNDK